MVSATTSLLSNQSMEVNPYISLLCHMHCVEGTCTSMNGSYVEQMPVNIPHHFLYWSSIFQKKASFLLFQFFLLSLPCFQEGHTCFWTMSRSLFWRLMSCADTPAVPRYTLMILGCAFHVVDWKLWTMSQPSFRSQMLWNIYLHLPKKWPSHVGKYSIHGSSGDGIFQFCQN